MVQTAPRIDQPTRRTAGVKTNAMIDDSGPELDAANVTPKNPD